MDEPSVLASVGLSMVCRVLVSRRQVESYSCSSAAVEPFPLSAVGGMQRRPAARGCRVEAAVGGRGEARGQCLGSL